MRQGWVAHLHDDRMEPCDQDRGMFTHIVVVNDVYPVRLTMIPPNAALAAWTIKGDSKGPTHKELVERLEKVAMAQGRH